MFGIALSTAILIGAPQLKEQPAKANLIVGRWAAEKILVGGADQSKSNPGLEYEFTADGAWVIYKKGEPLQGGRSFTSDTKTTPSSVDLTENNQAMPGIFRVEGDNLTITFRIGGKERPKGFDDPPGPLMTLQMSRVKLK